MSFSTVAPIQEKRKREALDLAEGTVHTVDVSQFLKDGETLESLYADDTNQTQTRRKEVLTSCLETYCEMSLDEVDKNGDIIDTLSFNPLDLRGLVSLHGKCYNNNTNEHYLKKWLLNENGTHTNNTLDPSSRKPVQNRQSLLDMYVIMPEHLNDETIHILTKLWYDTKTRTDVEDKFGKIGEWNTSNITNMNRLFANMRNFDEDLGGWDVSNVTDMSGMFERAEWFNQSLDAWDVSNVTNMEDMFNCAAMFNQPIGSWDVSKVTNMHRMFKGAEFFDQPIGTWNVSNVTNMKEMFSSAIFFNEDITKWKVGNVKNMTRMFEFALNFNQPIGNWAIGNVKNMNSMFRNAGNFNQPIGNWAVGNVKNMNSMFRNARKFNQPIGNWAVGNVKNMNSMFRNALAFEQDLSEWWKINNFVSKVNMFSNDDVNFYDDAIRPDDDDDDE